MARYLYMFGYCTPSQAKYNDTHDSDDESSAALFIRADSAETALQWGREVSDAYVSYLQEKAGWPKSEKWRDSNFSAWIEASPNEAFSAEQLATIPEIGVGEFPDFGSWL